MSAATDIPQYWWEKPTPKYRLNYSTGKDALIHIESNDRISLCGKTLGMYYKVIASTKNDLRDPFICKKCKDIYRTKEIIEK
jgi:hypothetical protein